MWFSYSKPSIKRQSGFSLIEVLVAIVILSIGLLGIAGLQLTGLRQVHNANLLFQAVIQANDISDRIRANSIGLDSGSYNNISGTGTDPGCIQSSCTPTQLAATDAFEWNTNNARLLPGGAGTVVVVAGVFTITVSWTEMLPTGPGTRTYILVIRA
jgi:type IV pilus assembly protein PilV